MLFRSGAVAPVPFGETDDPFALVARAVRAGARGGGAPLKVALSDRLWATFVLRIESALAAGSGRPELRLASEVIGRLRTVKSAEESALLRAAGRAVSV